MENKKIQIAKEIIDLAIRKIDLEGKLGYLNTEISEGRKTEIYLKNGNNGGHTWLRLDGDKKALELVNDTLKKYIADEIKLIDSEIDNINISKK